MVIMAVPVQTSVPATVVKIHVTYMKPVFHVILDGQGNSAKQVYIFLPNPH